GGGGWGGGVWEGGELGRVEGRGDGDPIGIQIEPDRLVHREVAERVHGSRRGGPRWERQDDADDAQGGQRQADEPPHRGPSRCRAAVAAGASSGEKWGFRARAALRSRRASAFRPREGSIMPRGNRYPEVRG